MFWILRFVERENASEKIRSLVETRGKRGCSIDDERVQLLLRIDQQKSQLPSRERVGRREF